MYTIFMIYSNGHTYDISVDLSILKKKILFVSTESELKITIKMNYKF